jgi:hypothetical protein
MPRAFARAPTYSFSIVAQTGSVIGGYTVENLGGGGVPYAILNDSRQVVFSADGNDGSYWIGYLTERVLLATNAQLLCPNKALNFFLSNAGQVSIDAATGVYSIPANASAPPSLLFNYSLMPGVRQAWRQNTGKNPGRGLQQFELFP